MAAFLSKVFPRKKEKETNKRSSASSLLEGKFEAVSPTVSPSAAKFEEAAQKSKERGREKEREKDKDKEGGFSLFRPKSRPFSPPPDTRKSASDTPRLTLNLPVPKEERTRALGVVFEADPDDKSILPDNVIGERRLNPLEALLLVKACSTAIIANGGLETLGVMHPFWYSASPEVQRKLISLFILSLAPKSPISTLSPSPTSALSSFDTELQYTHSPHDIAAVLRWALRHLRLEGDSFGRAGGQWKWYEAFAEAERVASYPLNAFSDALVPQVPPSHLQLLVATLDIVSSLAAHSEHNGISGSKLTKFFGLWLLTTKRSEQGDDWSSFYARWEHAGRILEHLFLAHIRDEMARKKMPLRLQELVKGYPYHSRSPSADSSLSADVGLLPRPRLTTRQYDALYVRVETQLLEAKSTKQKQHPLRLIADALKSELELANPKYQNVWEAIRKNALASDESEPILTHVDGYPSVSRIFADETIRLLSLVPAETAGTATSSVPTLRIPRPPRKRSSSLTSGAKANGNGKATTNGAAENRSVASPTSPGSPKDWMDFSTSGFGESTIGKDFANTLLDKDVEVTTPPPAVERKTSRKRKASPSRRSSVDSPAPESATRAAQLSAPPPPKSKSTLISLVKLDEAFIDFWSDALLDPISAEWPNFVVAQLKSLPGVDVDGKPISWVVLEQRFVLPPPPPIPAESEATSPSATRRASSPRPSMRSELSARKSSTLAAAKKRLTFFSSSQTLGGLSSKAEAKTTGRKRAKSAAISELGEIVPQDSKQEDKAESKQPEKEEQKAPEAPPKDAAVTPAAEAPKAPEPPKDEEAPKVPEVNAEEPKESTSSALVPPIVPPPASPTTSAGPLSPLTPTADDFPAVPVVDGLVATAAAAEVPAAVEPLKAEDAPTEDKPVLAVPTEPSVPADPTPQAESPQEKTLPPAPEPVVLTGETPGPQVALSTSEPAALAEISTKVDEIVAQAASSPEVDKLPAGEQTTEVVATKPVVEEIVPFATPQEAAAAAEEAEAEAAPAEDAPVAEAEVRAAEAPAPEPQAAVDPEPEQPAAASEPEVATEAPVPITETASEVPVEEAPLVSETTQLEPEAAPEEPVPEVVEAPVHEPVVEEPEVPEEPSAAPEEPAAAIEEPVPVTEDPIVSEPAAAIPAEPEAPAEPEPEPESEAPVVVAPEEPAREEEPAKAEEVSVAAPVTAVEEVADEEGAVVEDVAAPAADEVVVEEAVEETAVPQPEEIAEAPAALESPEEPAAPQQEPVPEEPAAVEVPAPAPEETPAAEPEAAPAEEPQVSAASNVEEIPAAVPETHAVAEERAPVVDSAPHASEAQAEEAVPAEPAAEPADGAPAGEPKAAEAVQAAEPEVAEKHENGLVHVETEEAENVPAPEAEVEKPASSEKPAAPEASSE